MAQCYICGGEILQKSVGRRDCCDHCNADLHCCLQCEFYDEKVHHRCRESQAEWVSDKKKANFCDYFRIAEQPQPGGEKEAGEARRRFDRLFKK